MNQNSERVLSFKRNTMFPFIEGIEDKIGSTTEQNGPLFELLSRPKETQIADHINWSKIPNKLSHYNELKTNELIIHDASLIISESENLAFTTLFRNTHPVHFNYLRNPKNEIII